MHIKGKVIQFEWDNANTNKSYFKHGIQPKESEEIFIDTELVVIPDDKHTVLEERFIAIGKTLEDKILFVVFTFRNKKIRVISARRMHKKEVKKYEKIKQKQTI